MDLNPQAVQLNPSCINAGKCDYGIYPLQSRFYMDQVPLDLFQFGKVSLNPKGAGFCWITGAKNFKASWQWFIAFRKRWGFTFQEKTNVKKYSVQTRLPYVKKFHQYLLYTAFNEEP